jgi:hypothetical protein
VRALEEAVRAGKVRFAAYSGEEEALLFAIRSGAFTSVHIQFSFARSDDGWAGRI